MIGRCLGPCQRARCYSHVPLFLLYLQLSVVFMGDQCSMLNSTRYRVTRASSNWVLVQGSCWELWRMFYGCVFCFREKKAKERCTYFHDGSCGRFFYLNDDRYQFFVNYVSLFISDVCFQLKELQNDQREKANVLLQFHNYSCYRTMFSVLNDDIGRK